MDKNKSQQTLISRKLSEDELQKIVEDKEIHLSISEGKIYFWNSFKKCWELIYDQKVQELWLPISQKIY